MNNAPRPSLHHEIHDVAARVIDGDDADGRVREADEHAAAGCSICARALVNARATAVDLAVGTTNSAGPPPSSMFNRLRERAAGTLASRKEAAAGKKPGRIFDPSAAVAHLHVTAPGESERIREVDDLAAAKPGPDDRCARYLAEVAPIIRFPLVFVSVVRGDRVGYRAEIGRAQHWPDFVELRREISYCTHALSTGAPYCLEDAGSEPFFRGNKAVRTYNVRAYAGCPIVTSRGIAIGNLCALDFAPRTIHASDLRMLSLYAGPVLAEIERDRLLREGKPDPRYAFVEPSTIHGLRLRSFVYRESFFRALIDAARALNTSHARPEKAALITVGGAGVEAVTEIAKPGEPLGRLAGGDLGLLIGGASIDAVEARRDEVASTLKDARVGVFFESG